MLSCLVSWMELRRNRSPAPMLLCYFLLLLLLLLTTDCEQRDESIGLINMMLVGHLTLKVILINELMLLLYLASGLTAVKSKASLSATACVGPGTHCTQGLTWTLTCSVIFRLFQQVLAHKLLH